MITYPRRLLTLGLLLSSLAGAGLTYAAPVDGFDETLEISLKEKKGVMVYIDGQAIAGRVSKISSDSVELVSREYARIVIRRDRIDAVAGN